MGKNRGDPTQSAVTQHEVVPEGARHGLHPEATKLLEAARAEMERAMEEDMQRVGALLAGRMDAIQKRLSETKAESQRIQAQTQLLQKDPVNDLLRQARDRLMGV